MSRRAPLPYAAAENVNRAAEMLLAAEVALKPLHDENRLIIREETDARVAKARMYITQALRHLESAGAQTKP